MAVQRHAGVLTDPGALRIDPEGVAWLCLEGAEGGIARLPADVLHALDHALDHIEREVGDRVRALVVQIGRWARRPPGEELYELLAADRPEELAAGALRAQATLRRLEQLPTPTFAAIAGPCLGAGLELALACSYRVATAASRLGLPQVPVGLIPGLGATVRLPRLVGLDAAIRLIVSGEEVGADRAADLGLVDLVVTGTELEAGVARFVAERIARGRARSGARRGMRRRLLEDTAPGRRVLLARAARRLARTPHPARTAARAALRCVGEGLSRSLDAAFEGEAARFGELATAPAAKSLLHAALLDAATTHPHPDATRPIERVAVLGAGDRAVELAWRLARGGIAVRLKDRERGAVTAAVHALRERLAAGSRTPAGEMVQGTTGFGGFGTLHLVIAPADGTEDETRAALVEAEEHVGGRAILASGSPLLTLAHLRGGMRDPTRVLGLIAPAPLELFPMLEIVGGPDAGPEAVAAACELARRLGLLPLHVGDGPGFLVHRLLAVLLAEAAWLVEEGMGVEAVDGAMEDFGFLMGPLRRIDAMGARRVARLLLGLSGTLGERARPAPILEAVARRADRFYLYRKGRPFAPNPELPLDAGSAAAPAAGSIRDRLLLSLINEAARVLADGVAASPADVDLAAIAGLGYPRRRGGLLYQADRTALPSVVERLDALATEVGERFAPAPLLRRLVADGRGFHPTPHKASGQVRNEMLR